MLLCHKSLTKFTRLFGVFIGISCNNDVNTTKLLVNQLKDNANNHYKMNHQTIPSDDSCLSPDHNAHNCKRCKEAVKYENATYCPECCCHYIDGKEVPAPEFTDVETEVCTYCKAEALAEADNY